MIRLIILAIILALVPASQVMGSMGMGMGLEMGTEVGAAGHSENRVEIGANSDCVFSTGNYLYF